MRALRWMSFALLLGATPAWGTDLAPPLHQLIAAQPIPRLDVPGLPGEVLRRPDIGEILEGAGRQPVRRPTVIYLNGFALQVESWTSYRSGPRQVVASGVARTRWRCATPTGWPDLSIRRLKVVETVRNPMVEIAREDALLFESGSQLGDLVALGLPPQATSAAATAAELRRVIDSFRQRGEFRVEFKDLVLWAGPRAGTALAVGGTATFPTAANGRPGVVRVGLGQFTLEVSRARVGPRGVLVDGVLVLPPSVSDPGTGRPGTVPLTGILVDKDCGFVEELPAEKYGPWAIGNTGVQVMVAGLVVDFSSTASAGMAAGTSAADPPWRGVFLAQGESVPPAGPITSNTGWLRAPYRYTAGQVVDAGFAATLDLTPPFPFTTLEPLGFVVMLQRGHVAIDASRVQAAEFRDTRVELPKRAVRDGSGGAARAFFGVIAAGPDLVLAGRGTVQTDLAVGELTSGSTPAYWISRPESASLRLPGTHELAFSPAVGGAFDPARPAADAYQGLFADLRGHQVKVLTADTPGQKPLEFFARKEIGWLVVAADGVHASIPNLSGENGPRDLGAVGQPGYLASTAFTASKDPYQLTLDFVSSAAYRAAMSGAVVIPDPVGAEVRFNPLRFTSTAVTAGGRLDLATSLTLAHWGVQLVEQAGWSSPGVISPRTGQILLTAAGIREPLHFEQPFALRWGQILADGRFGNLQFDLANGLHRLDGLGYTPWALRLSDYVPGGKGYLQTAGTVAFDLLGGVYVDVTDELVTSPPVTLADRKVGLAPAPYPPGFSATNQNVSFNWAGGLLAGQLKLEYDAADQDGFVAAGTASTFLLGGGTLDADLNVSRNRACLGVRQATRRELRLEGVARLGHIVRTSGCACLENGVLKRLTLAADLEDTADVSVLLRSASYASVALRIEPTLFRADLDGEMFLNVLLAGDLRVTGHADTTWDYAQATTSGSVSGQITTLAMLGTSTVDAAGTLDWQLGNEAWLQGRLAVRLMGLTSGTSAEGGFFVGLNAPKSRAWVMSAAGGRFGLDLGPFPDHLTGVYGYARYGDSISLYILNGGYEVYAGLGGFVLTSPLPNGIPPIGTIYLVGAGGVRLWGDILGGFVSASGWGSLQLVGPLPASLRGVVGLEGCVLWVACKSVDVGVHVSTDGFHFE